MNLKALVLVLVAACLLTPLTQAAPAAAGSCDTGFAVQLESGAPSPDLAQPIVFLACDVACRNACVTGVYDPCMQDLNDHKRCYRSYLLCSASCGC